MPVCRKCSSFFPSRVKVHDQVRNLCNRRFCLDCSPFGVHNTRPILLSSPELSSLEVCRICEKPTSHRRRRCGSCNTLVRRIRNKLAAIELLGGKCARCGWKEHIAGFEFHHIHGKDFNIGDVANRSWTIIKSELQKCELLCACCHRKVHSKRDDPKLIAEARRYAGSMVGS